jgi:adenylate cyclase
MSSRRLAAILCADVVGSSRLMEIDEPGTISAIDGIVYEVVTPAAARHNGRLIETTGDGAMLEFSSPLQAVTCAIEVQREATERCAGQAEHERLMLRIGINLGDVLVADDGDVYGDCVNVAVRLESLADPGGICVSAKVLDELQGKMTLAFEDRGDQQLKNIARPVRVFALGGERTTRAVATPLPVPDKPSIAVLPFTNLSGDPEQDYFADGIVDDILTALGRQRSLFVSARSSTFTYKGRNVDPKRVGSELGVRYLLLGSIRRAGNRVRITGRLIEAESGTQIWADRYDGALDDVFELQDEITASVAGAIEPRLRGAEIARARLKPPGNLTSYDRVLQALSHHYEATKEGVEKAIGITDKIIEDDPGYAQPYALGAWCRVYYLAQAWSADPASDGARGRAGAQGTRPRARGPLDLVDGRSGHRIHRSRPRHGLGPSRSLAQPEPELGAGPDERGLGALLARPAGRRHPGSRARHPAEPARSNDFRDDLRAGGRVVHGRQGRGKHQGGAAGCRRSGKLGGELSSSRRELGPARTHR